MGRLPKDLEEKRQHLESAARRGAFESYIRHGRVPEAYERIAALVNEAKRLGGEVSTEVPIAGAPQGRPTTHYVWRTFGDDRVRSSHAARDGQVFSWTNPPEHGHPGSEPNCRCWPEPYYGHPAVPDVLLRLTPNSRIGTQQDSWTKIDILTRPDGSIAKSVFFQRDGTRISSSFAGREISHVISAPRRRLVRVEKRKGVTSSYIGGETAPLVHGGWAADGTRPRSSLLAQRGPFWPDHMIYADPGGGPQSGGDAAAILALGALTRALIDLYNRTTADPASAGAGTKDVPIIAFKAWEARAVEPGQQPSPIPVMVDSLSEEQLRQTCWFLPDVQQWTDTAALLLAPRRPEMNAANWGSLVHKMIKETIDAIKEQMPLAYENIYAELSLDEDGSEYTRYGQKGSVRVDVLEDRIREAGVVCAYDVKTGQRGLTMNRVQKIAEIVARKYGAVVFFIIEVRPTNDHAS